MIELFQITGSSSFAARAALEEAGAEYATVDIHPRERDEPVAFGDVNPLRRVPALREGAAEVYETAAVLLYIGDRFPERELAPAIGDPLRGAYYRWLVWIADTLHPAWWPVFIPQTLTTDPDHAKAGIREQGLAKMAEHGAYLERELTGRRYCLGDRFSLADVYLYMLVGWQFYMPDFTIGGEAVQAHFARVGARPAIARARELDDLDERFARHNPTMRGGKPV